MIDRPDARVRLGWVTVLTGSHLARDVAGGAVLALLFAGIPPRVATIVNPSSIASFAAFPIWAQCVVLAAYTGQLGAETWGRSRDRFMAATISLCAASMAAALFWKADPWGGAFWQWTGHAAVQFCVLFAMARRIGLASHAP